MSHFKFKPSDFSKFFEYYNVRVDMEKDKRGVCAFQETGDKMFEQFKIMLDEVRKPEIVEKYPSKNTVIPIIKELFGDDTKNGNCIAKQAYDLLVIHGRDLEIHRGLDYEAEYFVAILDPSNITADEFMHNLKDVIEFIDDEGAKSLLSLFLKPQEFFSNLNISKADYSLFIKGKPESFINYTMRNLICEAYRFYTYVICYKENPNDPKSISPLRAQQIIKEKKSKIDKANADRDDVAIDSIKKRKKNVNSNSDEDSSEDNSDVEKKIKKKKQLSVVGDVNTKTKKIYDNEDFLTDLLNQDKKEAADLSKEAADSLILSMISNEKSYKSNTWTDIESEMEEQGLDTIQSLKILINSKDEDHIYLIDLITRSLKTLKATEFQTWKDEVTVTPTVKTPAVKEKSKSTVTVEKIQK